MNEETTLDEFTRSKDEGAKGRAEDWSVEKTKNHTELVSGAHIKSDKVHSDSTGVPYLTGPDDFEGLGFRVTKYTDSPTKFCEPGDTLVTVKGSGCGKTALSDQRACISRQLKALRPEASINPIHLYYSVKSKEKFLQTLSEGSAIPGLSNSHLTTLDIPVPPLPEQRKIATVLHTVDRAIKKTEKTVEQMDIVQQGLLRSLFGKEKHSRNPDIKTKTERLGPKQFQVPVTWETTEISSIGKVVTGDTPSTDDESNFGGTLPFVTPETLSQGKYVTESDRTLSEAGRNEAKPIPGKSVMMDCIGSDMGKVAVSGCEVATNQQINSVVIKDESYLPEFLYYHLQVLSDFIKSQAGQTATPIVNKSSFESFAIFNPPLEEQQEIVDTLSVHDEGRESNIEYLAGLKRLKRGLMQDLLSGTVRTTNTNIEVPEEIAQYG